MEQAAKTMEDFPEEVLWNIFFYLDTHTLCSSVALVCSKWHLLYTDDGIWRHLYNAKFGTKKEISLRKEEYVSARKKQDDIPMITASIDETNKIRASIGLAPLVIPRNEEQEKLEAAKDVIEQLDARIKDLLNQAEEAGEQGHIVLGSRLLQEVERLKLEQQRAAQGKVSLNLKATNSLYHWYEIYKERTLRGGRVKLRIFQTVMHVYDASRHRLYAWEPFDEAELNRLLNGEVTEEEISEKMKNELNTTLAFTSIASARGFREDLGDYIPMTMLPKKLSLDGLTVGDLIETLLFTIWAEGNKGQRDWILEREICLPQTVYQTIYF